jgi:putative acetyltransferase
MGGIRDLRISVLDGSWSRWPEAMIFYTFHATGGDGEAGGCEGPGRRNGPFRAGARHNDPMPGTGKLTTRNGSVTPMPEMPPSDAPPSIRLARPADDPVLAAIVRAGMAEFGICGGPADDPEVDAMSRAFGGPRAAYFVAESGERVLGGGGIGPLPGGPDDACELRKMYLAPEARGLGAGLRLLEACLAAARARGYRSCRLATLARMERARRLYERAGFRPVDAPVPGAGHAGCDRWYALDL